MTTATDPRHAQHAPRDFQTVTREALRLFDSGLQPSDVSQALRLNVAIVVRIVADREAARRRAWHTDPLPKPWLPYQPSPRLRDRAIEARRRHAAGEPVSSIARRLHLSVPQVHEAISTKEFVK